MENQDGPECVLAQDRPRPSVKSESPATLQEVSVLKNTNERFCLFESLGYKLWIMLSRKFFPSKRGEKTAKKPW